MAVAEELMLDAGVIGVVFAAIAGFLGWRVGTAQDAVRIKVQEDAIKKLTAQVEVLRADLSKEARDLSTTMSAVNSSLESTARLLDRMDQRIGKLEDRRDDRDG